MKVAVFLNTRLAETVGGGFSYLERLIQAIDEHQFDTRLEICFTGRKKNTNTPYLKGYFPLRPLWFYNLFRFLDKTGIVGFCRRFFKINVNVCNRLDIQTLIRHGVAVVFYPMPQTNETPGFPFISTNWDIGHLSTFAFPEFFDKGNHEFRNRWYTYDVLDALGILVESQTGKEEFIRYTNFAAMKIEVVPMFPGKVADLAVLEEKQLTILNHLGLKKNSYFFYPAQFWAHKNHFNLLQAFKVVVQSNPDVNLVFTGSDHGNKVYIKNVIEELGLMERVRITGFLSNEEIWTLYKNSIALVMPTFLGPTNMPLLEAQYLETAIICSDLPGHQEMCGDGALYADPRDSSQWVTALRQMLDPEARNNLISKSIEVRKRSPFNIGNAIGNLEQSLLKLMPIRKTFK